MDLFTLPIVLLANPRMGQFVSTLYMHMNTAACTQTGKWARIVVYTVIVNSGISHSDNMKR